MRRILLAVLGVGLSAVMVGAALAALPPGGTFTDDDGNVHEPNIEAIAAESITKGCNPPANSRYCPGSSLTRGQMAAFVRRALDLPASSIDYFIDDNDSVFEGDINALAEAGITRGCNPPTSDRYCPDGSITREQMAAFLRRAFDYPASAGDFFTDDDDSIFEADINAIADAGVTLGCNPPGNTRYCPSDLVKRDQMASFFARALGLKPIYPPPPTTTTSTTTTRPPTYTTFGPGTHRVGIDIPAGTYRNSGDLSGCYWERLSGFGGTFDDIIANNFTNVRQIVEVKASDAGFKPDGDCGQWSSDLRPAKAPTAGFGGGTWQVPSEVSPGLWRNTPSEAGCYWERLDGFSGEFDDTIANDFISDKASTIVRVEASDTGFGVDEDCGAWTYLGP